MLLLVSLLLLGHRALGSSVTLPTPVICEDSLGDRPPFDSDNVPCLLGCGTPLSHATGSLLPGSVNVTDIPYCQLNCVRRDATPAESAAAPDCYRRCQARNQATPENVGWCMYWCVGGLGDLVASTECVPSLHYGSPTTMVEGGETVTVALLTVPAAWQSWYETQTVISKSDRDLWGSASQTGSKTRAQLFPPTTHGTLTSTSGAIRSTSGAIKSTSGAIKSTSRDMTEPPVSTTFGQEDETGATTTATTTSDSTRLRVSLALVVSFYVVFLHVA